MTLTMTVCVKPTWRTDTSVRLSGSGKAIEADGAVPGLSMTDAGVLSQALTLRNGIRAAGQAVRLQTLTVGPPAAQEMLREALAAGVDECLRVWTDSHAPDAQHDLDGSATFTWTQARLAAQAIRPLKLSGPILVLTGDVSSDESHGSFGAFLAQALGLDFAHRATDLQPTATGWLTHVKLERGYRQELELEGSAVVTVAASGLKLPEADWPAWLASRTAAIPSVDVDPAEGKAPGPATVTVLRRPLPRVKRYSVPSSSLSAEARIRTLVGGKLQGSGVTLPASQGVARQVDATLTLLKSRGHLAAGPT